MALGVWLVSDGPTRLALRNARGVEREPRTRGAARMGSRLHIVLDVLAGVDSADGSRVVAVRIISRSTLPGAASGDTIQ